MSIRKFTCLTDEMSHQIIYLHLYYRKQYLFFMENNRLIFVMENNRLILLWKTIELFYYRKQ